MAEITIKKIKRGKYKKKERVELTPRKRRNNHLTFDILNGMTFEEASKVYNMNSAQAVQKQFRLTVINFFMPRMIKEIIDNEYDIKYLRRLWYETKL